MQRVIAVIYAKPNTKHLYEVGTPNGVVEVYANTRASAEYYAKNQGFEVQWVNMVG